jgi:hypothetical protein
MAHLTEDQRESVVHAATGIEYANVKALALAGLGAGIADLTDDQRTRFFNAMYGISDIRSRATVLTALAAGVAEKVAPQMQTRG